MCGIAGIVSRHAGTAVAFDRLARMRDSLEHRGPDGAGHWIGDGVGLGHRRLAIVDPASGQQPMTNEDGSVWVVFNGEIYNHAELRTRLKRRGHLYRTRCDTETILHLYDEAGEAGLDALEGMFAFAIWDRTRQQLVLGRDRLGIKPLYLADTGTELLFASEIKALIEAGVRPVLRTRVTAEYLANRYVSESATMFDGVSRLQPGTTLTWSRTDGQTARRFWEIAATSVRPDLSFRNAVDELREELRASVQRHLMSDVPLGVLLSGGIDSTALAAIAAEAMPGQLKTFSVGFREKEASELDFARIAAKAARAEHHEVLLSADEFFAALPRLIWHQDEPLAFTSNIPLFAVANLAREHVKVVLTGEGADELFLGYNRYRVGYWNARLGRPYWKLPAGIRRRLQSGIALLPSQLRRYASRSFLAHESGVGDFWLDNFSVFSRAQVRQLLHDAPDTDPFAFAERCYARAAGGILDRMSATDLQTYLHELLMKQDRMSMAASIESRVPFLDDRLLVRALSMPASVKLRGWTTKAVLRAAVADLIPAPILHRSKMGFPVPLSRWLRTGHRRILEEFVTGPRARARGLFDEKALDRLAAEHLSGAANHAERLWLLLNLEIWQRIFCDGEAPGHIMRPVHRPQGRLYAFDLDKGRRAMAGQHRRPASEFPDPLPAVGESPGRASHDAPR